MLNYGDFHSDVDARMVTIQQRYPGCGCVLDTTIPREELPDYTEQPDGTYIGLDPSGECASHLELETTRTEMKQLCDENKRLRDLLYRLADYVSKNVRTNDHVLAGIVSEAVIASYDEGEDDDVSIPEEVEYADNLFQRAELEADLSK